MCRLVLSVSYVFPSGDLVSMEFDTFLVVRAHGVEMYVVFPIVVSIISLFK